MTLSAWKVQVAVKLVLPGKLGKHVVVEGSKDITSYLSYGNDGESANVFDGLDVTIATNNKEGATDVDVGGSECIGCFRMNSSIVSMVCYVRKSIQVFLGQDIDATTDILVDDSLLQDLNANLPDFGLAKNEQMGDQTNVSTQVMGMDHGDNQSAMLKAGNKQLTQIVQDSSFREFEFRQYLFARQAKLLIVCDCSLEYLALLYKGSMGPNLMFEIGQCDC
ncbi:trafficking protein particle complex II-specific subunit 130 [Artemisia annua]|uniref:Trafficking protein particle complex II-specific subunit 130 n=1 Tax=Artemisia annua TaxID=35608 RepID=A0A2U1MKA0_ARTAN|nr:trafficking protein particle complex II-specific subunit 130 [Artemisia annua]